MRRVPITPADAVRHSPPGRGAIPPRPAIRSGSASSLASSDTSFSASAQQPPAGSRLGSMSSFGGRASFGSGGAGGGGGGNGGGGSSGGGNGGTGMATQPHPMRLTMELMNSLSPPLGGERDSTDAAQTASPSCAADACLSFRHTSVGMLKNCLLLLTA